jgi:hypothetical protein
LVELAAVVGVAGVGGSLLMVGGQPRDEARKKKDETQVRGIHQAMVLWAQNNKDVYPLPSRIDTASTTVKETGQAKDTTANILSLLVYNGAISTEILVSPAEQNAAVVVKENYQYDQPKETIKPAEALWDPSLSAELGPKKGNISYAHLQPALGRLPRWSTTFNTSEPIVATRAPQVKSAEKNMDGTVTPRLAKPDSIALTLLGDGKSWSGNMAFNDDHVEFKADKLADGRKFGKDEPTYTAKEEKTWPDIWCYDEPDDAAAANHFLGIFTKAGKAREDWKGAWD